MVFTKPLVEILNHTNAVCRCDCACLISSRAVGCTVSVMETSYLFLKPVKLGYLLVQNQSADCRKLTETLAMGVAICCFLLLASSSNG